MAEIMKESMKDLDPEGAIGEEDVDNAAHDKLLNSIYALDGKKRNPNEVRGAGISSSNLDVLVHTKAESTKITAKELKLRGRKPTLVPKPLSALQIEKSKRSIARDVMEVDTKKWEPIVHEIRLAPQIKYAERPRGMEMYKAMQPQKFSPRTPLEMELYEALGKSDDIINADLPFTQAEENALKAMSLEEAKQRRKELMLHHELLNRMQVKAKREKKIKSKRYRRGKRKQKEAEQKKRLEQLKVSDPQAFLEQLEDVEKARMEERLTLKHKAGGKFARYHKAYSKYDDNAREAIQEMIQKGKELTKKRRYESSDEDEGEEQMQVESLALRPAKDNVEVDDDVGETTISTDLNTRHLDMLKAINKKAGGWLDGSTKYVMKKQTDSTSQDAAAEEIDSSDNKEDAENNSRVTDETGQKASEDEFEQDALISESRKRKRQESHCDTNDENRNINDSNEETCQVKSPKKKKLKDCDGDLTSPTKRQRSTTEDGSATSATKKKRGKKKGNNSEKVAEKKVEKVKEITSVTSATKKKRKRKKKGNYSEKVAEKQVEKVKEITLKPLELEEEKDRDEDDEDGEGMAVTMEELFKDEDVVEQFARDKAEEEEKRRPKEESTKLPGWGSWSGPDYKEREERRKEQMSKRRRKFLPKPKNLKDSTPNLWLNPKRDEAIRKIQPKKVPFPYTSADQYQSANRQPVSRGFVREMAHKILIKPEVVTKLGHIIKPLDKDDFFKTKSSLVAEENFGQEIKFMGPINFRAKDRRLETSEVES